MRLSRVGLAIALSALPGLAGAQVAIEHQDVACIVAGKFPVLDACFRPGPDLARARVFFRPEGVPNWYYVEASTPADPTAPEASCRKATLPKPKKSLLKKHVEYYVEATGKQLESTQTQTYRPLVVQSEGECKTKLVAPFVPSATVQVFPSLPAAFAAGGGLSGAAVATVVGAGVAGGTGAVVAASTGGGPAPTTAPPATVPPTTAPPATQPPTTTTTTTLPPVAFNPVFRVFRGGVEETGSKISGTEPVQLRFAMCESTGPLPLRYGVRVNGSLATVGCDTTITFNSGGFAPGFGAVAASRGDVRSAATNYDVLMQVQSDGPGNDPKDSRALVVEVAPACGINPAGPTTTLLTPMTDQRFPGTVPFVDFTANADDSRSGNNGVLEVKYFVVPFGDGFPMQIGTGTSPPAFKFSWDRAQIDAFVDKETGGFGCEVPVTVFAIATDNCGLDGAQSNEAFNVTVERQACGTAAPASAEQSGEFRTEPRRQPAGWVSQLEVPGGRGQVVLNGKGAFFPPSGRAAVPARAQAGENRVEATLVHSGGQPGVWRFELGGDRAFWPGTLRVIAGQVALITQDTIVFRMKGRPGERVVFTFSSR